MTARIIAIEGSDGVGKATQTKRLVERLKEEGFKAVYISFPRYETPTGKKIRDCLTGSDTVEGPLEMSELFHEDRKNALPLILKMIEENDFLIFDRYKYSSIAHQGAKATNREEIIKKIEEMEADMPDADLIIFLSLPATISQKLLEKEKDRDLQESDLEYLERTNEIYKELSKRNNWIEVDCMKNDELLSVEEIHEKIYWAIKKFFSMK